MKIFVILVLSFCEIGLLAGLDSPCAKRWFDEGLGYVCVCNSSYCDTVNSPVRLQEGYHLYKSSNSSPGFTTTTGNFTVITVPNYSDLTFTINSSVEYQEIIGFGGSVTDSSCLNINYLPENAQEKFIESYFGPTGIEYNMLRIPIGGTDFSTRNYTLDDFPFDEDLSMFSLSQEDISMRLPFLKKAMSVSRKEIKLLGCTWSAPAWMKNGNQNRPEYINHEYYGAWSKYHTKFLDAYSKENLTLWSLSGGNEGMLMIFLLALQTPSLNSTIEYAPFYRTWLKSYMKPQLVASGYSQVKFLALEDQRVMAPYFMKRLARDPKAIAAVDGVALHWYWDFLIKPSVLDDLHQSYPDKLILYTETSINGEFGTAAVSLGSWLRASGYLYNIFENLDHYTNAYLDWNLALDEDGGPTLSFGIDAPVIINKTSGEFYKQPIFYAMGHFSKFIQPGAKKVQVISSQSSTLLKAKSDEKLAEESIADFISYSKSRYLSRSSLQTSNDTFVLTIPQVVKCLAFSNPDDSFTVIVLSTMNVTTRVKIDDPRVGSVTLDIEENSVNTFVYWP